MSHAIRGLYAIVDNSLNPAVPHLELASQLLAGGARLLQLRIKGGEPHAVSRIAEAIMALKRDRAFTFIVNDYPEIAAAVGADGVHVGKSDTRIAEARRIVGPGRLVGYSSHSLEAAVAAAAAGADYVAFGAVFPTATKGPDHPVQGLERLRAVARAVDRPVVAIGGINRENVRAVLAAGAAAFAMISALTLAPDSEAATRFFAKL